MSCKVPNLQLSCCVFDLETTNLNADFGVTLCGVIKPAQDKPLIFRADKLNPKWQSKRSDDSHLLTAFMAELVKYDIWIGHNADGFDLPWLRTRLAKYGLPPLPPNKLLDPVKIARRKLRMSYNSLDKLATFFGVNTKSQVVGDVWLRAALDGCKKSMNEIVSHCIEDCNTLERVVVRLKPYCTNLNSWGSGF